MNNGRIWCVVNPTVGLPLFLGSVTLIAVGVHVAVLNNTTWFADYWNGAASAKAAAANSVAPSATLSSGGDTGYVVNVIPTAVPGSSGAAAFTVVVSPKPQTSVTAQRTSGVAMAATVPK